MLWTLAFSPEMSHRWAQPDTAPVSVPADLRFSIWVSFFEIYNELLYDLLEPPSQQRKRQTLRLCEDQNGNPYVKGMGKQGGWHKPWRGPSERLGKELGAPILCMPFFPSHQISTGFMFRMLRRPGNS